jgi:hypothetical protein
MNQPPQPVEEPELPPVRDREADDGAAALPGPPAEDGQDRDPEDQDRDTRFVRVHGGKFTRFGEEDGAH